MGEESKPKFIFIVGPTATGKSELALKVAGQLNWPLINCDSIQIYRQVNIGTAKPTVQELQSHPHFLFDYIEPPEIMTAAQYLKDVKRVLQENQFNQAVFVGGSGFYVQALLKGLYPQGEITAEVKLKVNQWIEEDGYQKVFQWLQEKDPSYCAKISEQDHYRIRRSAEIILNSGQSISENKAQMSQGAHSVLPAHDHLLVGLNEERKNLRPRVEQRAKKMLELGLIEEVEKLLQKGYSHWAPLNSVGYKEVKAYLGGEIAKPDLLEQIVTSTMQLIKKQQTWFKRDGEIQWFAPAEAKRAYDTILQWAKAP